MNFGKIGKMKYIEELSPGDTFVLDDKIFLLSTDFKSSGQRMAISFSNGFPTWLKAETMVENLPLFRLDKDNNIIPIKYVSSTTQSVS